MNFLAHYFLLNENENPNTVFGNLMPDLYPNFTKFYNSILKNQINLSYSHQQILRGIKLHLEADKVFHSNSLFIDNYEFAKKQLNKIGVNRKVYVVAHILVELLIDRQILLNNQSIATNFYYNLNKIDKGCISSFINFDTNSTNNKLFLVNFISFIKHRHAFGLNDINSVPIVLKNILQNRLDLDDFFLNKKLNKILVDIESKICENLFKKIESIKLQIEI